MHFMLCNVMTLKTGFKIAVLPQSEECESTFSTICCVVLCNLTQDSCIRNGVCSSAPVCFLFNLINVMKHVPSKEYELIVLVFMKKKLFTLEIYQQNRLAIYLCLEVASWRGIVLVSPPQLYCNWLLRKIYFWSKFIQIAS